MPSYYVLIIDSLRPQDMVDNHNIATGLEAAIDAMDIPRGYFRATSKELFHSVLIQAYTDVIDNAAETKNKVIPILHFCMHGNESGIALSNNQFITWTELQTMLEPFYNITGQAPILCFSTCKGMQSVGAGGLSALSYKFVIGNLKAVSMNDAMAAFVAFYNGVYFHSCSVEELITIMRTASNNQFFDCQPGERSR